MKFVFILGIAAGFVACYAQEPKPTVSYVELICLDRGGLFGRTDTLVALRHHTEQDSLVGEITFGFAGADHVVRGWSNDHHAPIDGGSFWLELDSMGEIYGHSTTWPGFSVIQTNNDSVNGLISLAIAAASRPGHLGLRYPGPPEPKVETIKFIEAGKMDQN